MKSILSTLLVIIFLLCSCNKENKQVEDVVKIELGEIEEVHENYPDYFDVVQLIPLENKECCMFRDVLKLKATHNGFFLLGKVKSSNPSPMLFDNDGKFISMVGDYGHGKGEYQFIWDASPSESGDTIVLSLFDELKMYDSKGKYLQSKKLSDFSQIHSIISCPGGYVCATDYSDPDYQLHFLDKDLNITDEILPMKEQRMNYPNFMSRSIRISDGKLYYCDGYKTQFSIIDLKDHSLIKQIAIHSDNTATIERISNPENQYKSYDAITRFYVYGDFVKGEMEYNSRGPEFELDLKTDTIRTFVQWGYIPRIYDYDGEFYYDLISAKELLKIVKDYYIISDKTKKMFQKAYSLMGKEITELDNYVIVKLKKAK
ncbi:MAG: 6-bladed beta-propeller [Bacteroidaceae bacterium]|nr:6-bladed beta-propeller [Bacteroidaceae bacterium]